jgi:hypothetical protein
MNTVGEIEVNVHKLFGALDHDSRSTGLVLALLEVIGHPEVEVGKETLGTVGEHIRVYREQFRGALGLTGYGEG